MKRIIAFAIVPLATVTPALAQAMAPAEYVKAAGAGDLFERQSSQIVLETTRNPKVRDFATMMIKQHTKSTADVKAAAAKARVPVAPPMLTPAQAEMIAQLRGESGPARDATYIAQQRAAHGQALAVQEAYAKGGRAMPLKMTAMKIVPVVKMHITMLKGM